MALADRAKGANKPKDTTSNGHDHSPDEAQSTPSGALDGYGGQGVETPNNPTDPTSVMGFNSYAMDESPFPANIPEVAQGNETGLDQTAMQQSAQTDAQPQQPPQPQTQPQSQPQTQSQPFNFDPDPNTFANQMQYFPQGDAQQQAQQQFMSDGDAPMDAETMRVFAETAAAPDNGDGQENVFSGHDWNLDSLNSLELLDFDVSVGRYSRIRKLGS